MNESEKKEGGRLLVAAMAHDFAGGEEDDVFSDIGSVVGDSLAAMKKIVQWLGEHHQQAARSLTEGQEETLTVHRLGLPDVLRRTFRSANPIESMFDKVVYRSRRVKSWKGRNQVVRWAASSLLLHERKFRRIRGYKQMHMLVTSLENRSVDNKQAVA